MVVLITHPEPILIALEAKMYDRPSKPELVKQLAAQKSQLDQLCTHLAAHLNVKQVRLAVMPRHVGRERATTRSDVVDG